MSDIPPVNGIAETILYVEDLDRAREFYTRLFGFEVTMANSRGVAMAVGRDVLLLFKKGGSVTPHVFDGGTIPPHDGGGNIHMAFAIAQQDFDAWCERLVAEGVEIESTVNWELGGKSVYFRDPDNHNLELVTPGTWPNY